MLTCQRLSTMPVGAVLHDPENVAGMLGVWASLVHGSGRAVASGMRQVLGPWPSTDRGGAWVTLAEAEEMATAPSPCGRSRQSLRAFTPSAGYGRNERNENFPHRRPDALRYSPGRYSPGALASIAKACTPAANSARKSSLMARCRSILLLPSKASETILM
jgi:hypothetical protein